jgi:nitroreductase
LDVFEAIMSRRSIRSFTDEKVTMEEFRKILDAARLAPSGSNLQGWKFIVITDQRILNLVRLFSPGFLGNAPAAIVVCSDLDVYEKEGGELGKNYIRIADCAMAVENMLLAAHALGLGACVIKSFSRIALKEILELPERIEPEFIVILGHPKEQPKAPPKKSIEEIAYLNRYGVSWASEVPRSG